jgi:transposase-like protein
LKLTESANERFYSLQIENKEGRGYLKRHSNRTIILNLDPEGVLLGYHFEQPQPKIVQPELINTRKAPRIYTKHETSEILRLFWEGVPVSTIAKQIGINHDSLLSFIARYKQEDGVGLNAKQVASVHKMLETCSDSEKIARILPLPLCMVREVKREWCFAMGETFGLTQGYVRLILAKCSVYTPTELQRRGYRMETLAQQVGLSVNKLGVFLKMIR